MNDRLMTIAALDTSGGAGISQDTRVAYLHHTPIVVCTTGITLQTHKGVEAIYPTDKDIFWFLLKRMLDSYPVKVIKIGCICNIEQIDILIEILTKRTDIQVVLDPVLKPSKGIAFIDDGMIESYKRLLKVVDFLCPNMDELAMLSDCTIVNWNDAVKASLKLVKEYELAVLLKGGHTNTTRIKEGIISKDSQQFFTKARKNFAYSHGTGCALSTAFACGLMKNENPFDAFKKASIWVSKYYAEGKW